MMNIQDLGSIGEVVAALATVATLVYLALQIRQNTESVQTQAELSLSHQTADWAKEVLNNPQIATIWNLAASDPEKLDNEQRMLFLWFVFQFFLIVEGHYQLHAKGRISQRAWAAKADAALGLMENPYVKVWWDERVPPFNPEFVDHLDARRDTVQTEWKHLNIDELMESRP